MESNESEYHCNLRAKSNFINIMIAIWNEFIVLATKVPKYNKPIHGG